MTVVHAKLIVIHNDINGYINYIFQNLDECTWINKYFMTTRYPNWETSFPNIGDEGYLIYTEVYAGEDYYNNKTGNMDKYNCSHLRFEKFLPVPKKQDGKYIM